MSDLSAGSDLTADLTAPSPLWSHYATVPGLFARRSLNLIVGDAKVGRMRLALTQLNSYAAAVAPLFMDQPVVHPVQLGCLLCSRDYDRTLNDIQGMDLENLTAAGAFPVERWHASRANEGEPLHPLYAPYKEFLSMRNDVPKTRHGAPRFLLIENLQRLLVGKKNTNEEDVAVFLDLLHCFCTENDCTILATIGTPKMKKGECYPNVAHWIRGCAEWGEGVDTIIGIEEVRSNTTNGLTVADAAFYRKLYVKPPGQPMLTRWARFLPAGNLVMTGEPGVGVAVTGNVVLDQRLMQVGEGERLTRGDLQVWGRMAGVSQRTTDRWIAQCLEFGLMVKVGHGMTTVYVKAAEN